MIEKLKKTALRQGMKLMANPKVLKMMADPRLMNAISQGFAIKGRIQSEIDHRLRWLAHVLNLATKEDVEALRQDMEKIEFTIEGYEQQRDA